MSSQTITDFIKRAQGNLLDDPGWGYLESRRTPYDFLKFNLGYVPPNDTTVHQMEGRVIFPIYHPWHGELVGITGRSLEENPDQKKYVHTAAFPKKRIVYTSPKTTTLPFMVVVEGHFDMIALETAGIPAACVCGSSAPTIWQAALLMRITDNIILWPDYGVWDKIDSWRQNFDRLGFKRIEYGIYSEGAADPDEMIRDHKDHVEKYLCSLDAWNW